MMLYPNELPGQSSVAALGTGVIARSQAMGSESASKPPLALTPGAFLQVELKSQEAQSLQQERDQNLNYLQQYVAAYQQLLFDKDVLQKQVLLHSQLMEQQQQEEAQSKEEANMARQELQETQVSWNAGPLKPCLGRPATCVPSHALSWPLRGSWKLSINRTSSYRPS